MSEPRPSLVVGGSDDEPLVLAGPPRELSGTIDLHNPSDAKVVLRDAGLKDPSGVLRLPSRRHALAPLVLRPDQGGTVPLSIAVDPTTPPGEYRAELDVGGRTRPVVLLVSEVFDLTLLPRSLVVDNAPGVPQKKRLTVTNDGNVAFTLGDPGTVDLRDDLPRDRVLRFAIEPLLGKETPDLEALVVALLAVARGEGDRLGSAEVRVPDGPVDVRPGETKAVDLVITVQHDLPHNRRYRGRLPVLTRDVDVIVLASSSPMEKAAPPQPRRKAPQSKRSTKRRGAKR